MQRQPPRPGNGEQSQKSKRWKASAVILGTVTRYLMRTD
nr:MAG TPA: hypothetical protein [Caudoviricetes sp.]